MLRLNSYNASKALGEQMLTEMFHLKSDFDLTLLPVLKARLEDRSIQRDESGSISLGSAITLFLLAAKVAPQSIAEIGTYIGCSTAALAFGASKSQQSVRITTCDTHPCIEAPLAGLGLEGGASCEVVSGRSTTMFERLSARGEKIDLLHIDGRLQREDSQYLAQAIENKAIIALDDCEGDEKGHANLSLLRNAGMLKEYFFIQPFAPELFGLWHYSARSLTGILLPISHIFLARQ